MMPFKIDINKAEKTALIILALALLAGSVILYVRNTRPVLKIAVTENGVKERLTLREVEEAIRERRRVPINTAGAEDLTAIPGVGEMTAARIIEYRETRGPFYAEEDLLGIEGIGPAKLEKIRPYIKIEEQ